MSQIETTGSQATITPQEDVVSANSKELRDELIKVVEQGSTELIIDLNQVEMVDSSGLGVFISTFNSLKEKQGVFRIINASPDILNLMKIMRLDAHFEILGRKSA